MKKDFLSMLDLSAAEVGSRQPPVMGVQPWGILVELIEAA